jgi:hypothetical protein
MDVEVARIHEIAGFAARQPSAEYAKYAISDPVWRVQRAVRRLAIVDQVLGLHICLSADRSYATRQVGHAVEGPRGYRKKWLRQGPAPQMPWPSPRKCCELP